MKKLFAVYLGGRAFKCNTELHDVVFVSGETLEATYPLLLTKWFGDPQRLHIDSWVELNHVDGYQISLSRQKAFNEKKLFFVNLGAYISGKFIELHENTFYVCENELEAKQRASKELCHGLERVHRDDLLDVNDCLELSEIDGYYLHIEKSDQPSLLKPTSRYHKIPTG